MNIIETITKDKKTSIIPFTEAIQDLNKIQAEKFFTDSNVNGYFSQAAFLNYVRDLNRKNLEELQLLFEYMSSGYKINSLLSKRTDRNGKDYFWLKISLPNAEPELKLILEESMSELIRDYQHGRIKTEFTLEELYQEAIKSDQPV